MLQGGYSSVLDARSLEEFRGEVIRFAQDIGFRTVGAFVLVDQRIGRSEYVAVHNAPQGYEEAMHDQSCAKRDPVIQHCLKQTMPIIWDQATYTARGVGDLWEEQAHFGYMTGIAMALHLPEGRHFVFGVDRDQALPRDPAELTRLVADVQLFAVCAQEAAVRVLTPATADGAVPRLTPREAEVLSWTMEGKTAWEVGAILGITERTVSLHVANAMQKLGAANKHQAVLKALRLGLIH
ncbi:LuxR family transcriptional regulator [Ideonella sp. A 288]|uniref:helix-turn-helix transcriptional regulator n=1 Tax=Ideonella sp. A 288 TaxID=1962181 RepID=UPI000B4BB33D|nr:LuxR family transcriptional regulator [Ideonella sp. A 288]